MCVHSNFCWCVSWRSNFSCRPGRKWVAAAALEASSASRRSSNKPPWRPASKSRWPRDASHDAPAASKADGSECLGSYIWNLPLPVPDFRQVLTVFINVALMFDQLVLELLLQVDGIGRQINVHDAGLLVKDMIDIAGYRAPKMMSAKSFHFADFNLR